MKGRCRDRVFLSRNVQERAREAQPAAAEFEKFAAGDYANAGRFAATFKSYAEWAKAHGKTAGSAQDALSPMRTDQRSQQWVRS